MKRVAFTLAEVLITLGIIGVVAALTLPPLIQHHNKVVWVNQLKKSVSTVENALKMMMAEEGVDNVFDLSSWVPDNKRNVQCTNNNSDCSNFINTFKKYIQMDVYPYLQYPSSVKPISSLSGSKVNYPMEYKTLDGTQMAINLTGKNDASCSFMVCHGLKGAGTFVIDVNGEKKPNQFGRDIFLFVITTNGNLRPYGSNNPKVIEEFCNGITACISAYEGYGWRGNQGSVSCTPNINNSIGCGCAARIIENGWKMDY